MGSVLFVVREAWIGNTDVYRGSEWTVYAEVPAAGGDGALVAVYESKLAADTFAAAMNALLAQLPIKG